MCDICSEDGTETRCLDCRERAGLKAFPFDRGNWNFSGLWDYCWTAFTREWVMLSLSALAFMGLTLIVQMVATLIPLVGVAVGSTALSVILNVVGTIVQTVVQGVLSLGLVRMCYEVLEGQKADIGRLFSQLHKTVTYFLTMLLVFAMVGIPAGVVVGGIYGVTNAMGLSGDSADLTVIGVSFLVLLVPMVYFLLPLMFLQPAMVLREDLSPMGIIRHCYAVARGERLSILGVAFVMILLSFAGVLACCVGIFPALGLIQLLAIGLYLALRNEGSDFES